MLLEVQFNLGPALHTQSNSTRKKYKYNICRGRLWDNMQNFLCSQFLPFPFTFQRIFLCELYLAQCATSSKKEAAENAGKSLKITQHSQQEEQGKERPADARRGKKLDEIQRHWRATQLWGVVHILWPSSGPTLPPKMIIQKFNKAIIEGKN